jgi:hypothetical protein
MKKTALALAIIVLFLVPPWVDAQTTTHYGRDAGVNPAAFDLTIYSPNNQTTYAETMLLKFNITWTTYPVVHQIEGPLNGKYSYSVDNNPPVSVVSNQSASDVIYITPSNNFTVNPSFSCLVDVSGLANGNHEIVLKASLYIGDYLYFNESTVPTLFSIQNPEPTPRTETFPATLVFVASIGIALAVIGLLVYIKKRHRQNSVLAK